MQLSVSETRERLGELELFRDCGHDDLDRLVAVARSQSAFAPGETLYSEGDPARDCYVIIDGETEITVSGRFLTGPAPPPSWPAPR